MPVSQEAREAVKARCDSACCLFHRSPVYDGCEIVHFRHQGFGGRLADSWENDPKNLIWACRSCHDKLHGLGTPWKIVHMDPDHVDEEGKPDPILDVVDSEMRKVSHDKIWLHLYPRRAQLAEILESVRGAKLAEGVHAAAMLALAEDYDLIEPDAADAESMFSSQGFDSDHAIKECHAASWIKNHELEWPPGLPLVKVLRFAQASQRRLWEVMSQEEVQAALLAALDMPKKHIDESLREKGIKIAQPFFYLAITPGVVQSDGQIDAKLRIIRTKEYDEMMEKSRQGEVVVQLLAFRKGWKFKRGKGGGLYDAAGNAVPYTGDDDQ
jgi:hypothetical protein